MPHTRNASGRIPAAEWLPLAVHILPTLAIGFGIVIPGSCIDGLNQYTIGFLLAVLGFAPAYAAGIKLAKRRTARG